MKKTKTRETDEGQHMDGNKGMQLSSETTNIRKLRRVETEDKTAEDLTRINEMFHYF